METPNHFSSPPLTSKVPSYPSDLSRAQQKLTICSLLDAQKMDGYIDRTESRSIAMEIGSNPEELVRET